jgi:hypothetical protein
MENSSRQRYWAGILGEQQASGLTKKAFCEARNINPAAFYYWQRRVDTLCEEVPIQGFQQLQPVADYELTVCLAGGEVVLRSSCITTLAQVAKALSDA